MVAGGGTGSGSGGSGTAAQKKTGAQTAAKLAKMSKVLAKNKSGEDAFPRLSFRSKLTIPIIIQKKIHFFCVAGSPF